MTKYQIIAHFRGLKGERLFEGGRLFDNLESRVVANARVDAYSRGCLIKALLVFRA